ncbi:unnamed protein product [Rotaria sordida]|uniref:Large ribosomal subunit protein eL24 n=1 Tax=Rotaria sordida TaxID=392033 RepID=A0A818V508_9BILA|nr:unnamed protein product [Rotaria sordida]CAF3903826.1 unnamed protein product [Rotaria sordida]
MPCSWSRCIYCCCCCQCYTNIGATENGVSNTGGNKSTSGQWDIYLDSQYDTLTGSLIIASEESDTCFEYIHRSFHILSISTPIILVEAILVIVFSLMFVFGCKYSNDCPKQPLLIIYHLIGGGVGSLFWLWLMLRALRRKRQESGLDDDDDTDYDAHLEDSSGGQRLKDNGIWFMELLAFIFLLISFLMGNYWTWSIFWPAQDMTETQPIDWCNHSLYIFTLEICNYSGYKIYPGHGKRVVKIDGKVHIYLNSKCQRSADMRRNPRRVTWTVYYRRKHKKGAAEQEVKKRTRRNIKFQRAITGVTWNEILAKRNQQPEFRKAQRQDAINAAKQAKKTKALQKKAVQSAVLKSGKPVKKPEKIQKNIPKAGPKKGTQR